MLISGEYSITSGWSLSHPRIAPARGPPWWEDCDAQVGEGAAVELDWDLAAQAAPDFEVGQRVNW